MGKVSITLYGGLAKIAGERTTDIEALTLKDVIDGLAAKYGESFKERVYDERGKVARFLNIYINGKDIRFLSNLNTKLKDNDEISFMPAVGGG